jgi:uncharacterized protein
MAFVPCLHQRKGTLMAPEITGLYAAPLAVLMVALCAHVIMLRAKTKISIMDGGNVQLAERMRRHSNFTENVPMVLLLMAIAELLGAPGAWLHGVGVILLVGRIVHIFGIRHDDAAAAPRIAGASATLFATLLAAGLIAAQIFGK